MPAPSVTVIMPIRNEAAFIARSLGAVLAQDYPSGQIEVLVVDGMSNDGTRAIVLQLAGAGRAATGACGPAVTLLDNPSRIVPTALNIGLRHSRGDVIVRVDGHCEIAPDYVRRCIAVLAATGANNVGGCQRAVGQGWVGRAIALATATPFGVGNGRFHYDSTPGWADTVYLGAYPRSVFEQIGGFDQELTRNQDDEFNFRLVQAGGKIWLDPSIKSIYHSRPSLRRLWRQYYQYGFYKVRVIQKRGGIAAWRHLVPVAFVLALPASLLLGACFKNRRRWALSVVGPYGAASGIASLHAARHDWQCLPLLPLVFLILHLAYGLGFLMGLRDWLGRRGGS